jgi:type I restriction enzyme S subunit
VSFFSNAKGWPEVPLVDIATLQRGYDLPVQCRREGSVPIYAANGQNGTHSEVKLDGPGVVTGRSGTIGKVHYVEGGYWPLNTALYVKNFHGNDPKWVSYMLQAFKLDRFVEGAGVPTLNRNLVHGELIPLPPLNEQKRIAAILDKADAIRRKRQQAIQLSDQFLRAVFSDMFGEYFHTRGYKRSPRKSIAELTTYIDYRGKTPEKSKSGIPLITAKNVKKGYISEEPREFIPEANYEAWMSRGKPLENDVLFTTEAPLGNVALLGKYQDVAVGQRLVALRTRGEVTHEYLLCCLLHPFTQNMIDSVSSGSTVKGIRTKELYSIEVPVPCIGEQRKFSEIYWKHKSGNGKQFYMKSDGVDLFSSLSQKAFAGEL